MRKFLMSAFILAATISYGAVEVEYEDFSSKEPIIQQGLKQAKENIKTTFVYNENDMYRIYARAGFITTIYLNPDEKVIYLAGGDTARWVIDVGSTGSNKGQQQIVAVKPFFPSIKTNLVVNTDKRSYNFFLHSAKDWYNPAVTFVYPQDEKLAKLQVMEMEEQSTPINIENLRYDYKWKKTKDKWCPEQVFDDGKQTFILMPEKVNSDNLPVLLIRDEQTGKSAIVRHRYNPHTRFFVVDRLFEQGILQYGKKTIEIKRKGSFIKNPKDYYPVR